MNDAGSWAAAVLAGAALGAVFFGGLWWTVRRGATAAAPARWFIGSLVVRMAVVLAGFYGVGSGEPLRLGLCLLGFLMARGVVIRWTRPSPAEASAATPGVPPCA